MQSLRQLLAKETQQSWYQAHQRCLWKLRPRGLSDKHCLVSCCSSRTWKYNYRSFPYAGNALAMVLMVPAAVIKLPNVAELEARQKLEQELETTRTTTVVVWKTRTTSQRLIEWAQRAYQMLKEFFYIAIRGSQIVVYASPIGVLLPLEYLISHLGTNKQSFQYTWSYVRWSITQLGPAFCKLAQWMATRRDLFPRRMADELSKLQDRGLPHARHYTLTACETEFGEGIWKDLDISDTMIGCGSAAQVYKGTYKGKPVAIKVLHPNLYTRMQADLHLAQAIANALHHFVPMLNLPESVSNFGAILLPQADLAAEASHLRTFHENFGTISFVRVPQPLVYGETVLVEELVEDARRMTEYLTEEMPVRKELAGPLLRAFLKMIFLDNFVHCDLHSGNILVQEVPKHETSVELSWDHAFAWMVDRWNRWGRKMEEDSDDKLRRRIVLLDAGIVVQLQANDLRNLRDLFKAVILNDGAMAGRLMVERSRHPFQCRDVEAFAEKVDLLVQEFHDNRKSGLTLGAVRIGSLLTRVLDVCHEHSVEIDPNMASIVVSTLVLEGLGRSLDPDLNLIDFAIPFVLGRGRI